MRELTLTEIDNVSGADLGSRLNAAIVGGVAAFLPAPSGVEPVVVMALYLGGRNNRPRRGHGLWRYCWCRRRRHSRLRPRPECHILSTLVGLWPLSLTAPSLSNLLKPQTRQLDIFQLPSPFGNPCCTY